MSEPKLISPMLDNFAMGDPVSDHNGVRCCPAMENETGNKYIVKIISIPATQTQLDALLLTGVYESAEAADSYFKTLAEDILEESLVLERLSRLEGFLPYERTQMVPMDDGTGYDVYIMSPYRNTLAQLLKHSAMTHLSALNLALDLCAALTISRRSGYLYVNLKPENVYFTTEKNCKIGDIGFLSLNSLRFSSLPDRYRSAYTAPEISDALSDLNTTVDIYALGLILYQIFNDGVLPSATDENGKFAPPAYADYEMAEIILKACDPDPANRWRDPVEMGQSIVSYMQRNGVHDTPIVPVAPVEVVDAEPENIIEPDTENEIIPEEEIPDTDLENNEAEEFTNLSFLTDENDETAPEASEEEIEYTEVSTEVSDILEQADDLISHPTPDPVVQPEAIDVQIPDPIVAEEEPVEEEAEDNQETEDAPVQESEADDTAETAPEADQENTEDQDEEEPDDDAPVKKSHWLRNIIVTILLLSVAAIGYLFYTGYYLQPIDTFKLIEHENGDLTVEISSPIDESKLTVVCSDTYGNQSYQKVKNGKAVFTELAPDSAYTVKVVIDGFHKLTGDTSGAFTTPVRTNIVQFQAVTGTEDGSAILSFVVDGPDSSEWKIQYKTDDGQEQVATFTGHMYTVTGLTAGTEYKFTLSPVTDLNYTGITELTHKASNIIKAQNLQITGYVNGVLTVKWAAADGVAVDSWTVRCYNESGYNKTVVVNDTTASFEGVDISTAHTIEVTAANMSVNEKVFAAANSINVTEFKADTTKSNVISLSWNSGNYQPEKGWLLMYTVDGSPAVEVTGISKNSAELTNIIPDSTYVFTLQTKEGPSVFGGQLSVKTGTGTTFSGYGIKTKNITFSMCETPSKKNWDKDDLKSDDYKTSFAAGEKASFLAKLSKGRKSSKDKITVTYVIRKSDNTVVSLATSTDTWNKMWNNRYCELNVPAIPSTAGEYSISIYFNGSFVHSQNFTVK